MTLLPMPLRFRSTQVHATQKRADTCLDSHVWYTIAQCLSMDGPTNPECPASSVPAGTDAP
jgi:hypothetical protein